MVESLCRGVLSWCIRSAFYILSRGEVLFFVQDPLDEIAMQYCFLCVCGAYIYRFLVSYIYYVIHTECRNILNLLYGQVQFSFVGMTLLTVYIRHSNLCIFTWKFI